MKLFLLSREDLSGFGPNSTNWTLYYFKIYDVVLHLTYQNFAFKNPNSLQRKQDKDRFFFWYPLTTLCSYLMWKALHHEGHHSSRLMFNLCNSFGMFCSSRSVALPNIKFNCSLNTIFYTRVPLWSVTQLPHYITYPLNLHEVSYNCKTKWKIGIRKSNNHQVCLASHWKSF